MRPFLPGVTSEIDKMNRSDLKKVNQYIQYYSAFGRIQIRFLRDTFTDYIYENKNIY